MSRFRLTSPPKPKLSENDVERACLDVLRYRGYRPVRVPAGKYRTPDGQRWVQIGEPGMPDYVIQQFFLEVKRPGGRVVAGATAQDFRAHAGLEPRNRGGRQREGASRVAGTVREQIISSSVKTPGKHSGTGAVCAST